MPYLINWQPGSLQGNPITGLQAGTYVYAIIDGFGCGFTDTVLVPQPDSLTIKRKVNPAICEGRQNGSIFIEVEGGTAPYNYLWSNQAITQNLENIGKGFYSLRVSDMNQCVAFDTITVHEISCELFIPNVYTPNSDGVNDNFVIVGIEFYPDNQLLIFNRWGKEILQFVGYKNEWDGRDALGDKVADGVYYYILRLNDGRQFQGSITIMRE
jgi:gliding motility-associated-like protein